MSNPNLTAESILKTLSQETGKLIAAYSGSNHDISGSETSGLYNSAECFTQDNPWHTPGYIRSALEMIRSGLIKGFGQRSSDSSGYQKTIAFVIHPGAPFEGLGEILFTALCGFRCVVRLPPESVKGFKLLLDIFGDSVGQLSDLITLTEGNLPSHDGLVGINAPENRTAAAYLSRKPNLMLSMKGSAVTLTGHEKNEELVSIAGDICSYYGKSFYSLKSLRVPRDYNFNDLFLALEKFSVNSDNHRYFNHYEYHKSIFLINGIQHLDNGFILLTPDKTHTGKTAVVTYFYPDACLEVVTGYNAKQGDVIEVNGEQNQALINGMVRIEERFFYNADAIFAFLSGL